MIRVKFHKITASQLSSLPIIDGQIIFITDTKDIYLDSNDQRIKYTKEGVLDITTGTENGKIKVYYDNGVTEEIYIYGLKALAFKDSLTPQEVNAIPISYKGAANGVAELGNDGKVPESQLPSFVDDVLEGYFYNNKFYKDSEHTQEYTPEAGKIYVDLTTNKTYRWSGSAYIVVSETLALGETSSTAYRGDRGKAAYQHGVTNKGSAFTSGFYKITTNSEGHVTAATAVVKKDITDLGVPASDTTYSAGTGLTLNGTTFNHSNSATAGTYKSVTIDEQGHVTAGTNPTTLSGYGITDAKIASGVITLGSNTITPLTASSTLDATKLSGTIPTSCYTNTKNTAGSTNTSNKIYLIGATSQTSNSTTYSDDEVFVTSGVLQAKSFSINNNATLTYDSTNNYSVISGDIKISGNVYSNNPKIAYGTCETAAATAQKVITIADPAWDLQTGNIIGIKFSETNTASSCTFNVNNSGAKSIYYNTAVYTGTSSTVLGIANTISYYMYDGTNWIWLSIGKSLDTNTNTVPSAYCTTAAATAAKTASCTDYALLSNSYLHVLIKTSNTSASALTLNVNSKGAKSIYINGSASSASNYTLPAGTYLVFYDGTNYYFRTDGKITGVKTSSGTTTGTFPIVYTGTTDPTASIGNNGDIYIKIAS